jgi:glucose-1-phosphate thymidylyltransferase
MVAPSVVRTGPPLRDFHAVGSHAQTVRTKSVELLNASLNHYVPEVELVLGRTQSIREERRVMRGVLLAGGLGTRLYPLTRVISKHLLPIYDKPMVFYPLSTLMLAGIRTILLISTPQDLPMYHQLLGDGSELGLSISYAEQPNPEGGIAQALTISQDFLGGDSVALILGDNIFYGYGLSGLLQEAVAQNKGATIFAYSVKDPEKYGVAILENGALIGIEEKPKRPKSNYAITGLYLYDNSAVEIAGTLKPSSRGQLEITDVNSEYLRRAQLRLVKLGRGVAWLDTGTPDSLLETAQYVATIEHRQGLKVACIEEVAYRMGYISASKVRKLAESYVGGYRSYLESVVSESPRTPLE